jgi:hypothetical protein
MRGKSWCSQTIALSVEALSAVKVGPVPTPFRGGSKER